jgi:hypothetical protein
MNHTIDALRILFTAQVAVAALRASPNAPGFIMVMNIYSQKRFTT